MHHNTLQDYDFYCLAFPRGAQMDIIYCNIDIPSAQYCHEGGWGNERKNLQNSSEGPLMYTLQRTINL